MNLSKEERVSLKQMLIEVTKSYETIEAEREQIKDAVDAIHNKFSINKKIINKLAKTLHKHNYAEYVKESEEFEILYESVVHGNNSEEVQ